MADSLIKEYSAFNVVSNEWFQRYEHIEKKVFKQNKSKVSFQRIEEDVKLLLALSESVYENIVLDNWFKAYVKRQNTLLLWFVKEYQNRPQEHLISLYKMEMNTILHDYLEECYQSIKCKKKLIQN